MTVDVAVRNMGGIPLLKVELDSGISKTDANIVPSNPWILLVFRSTIDGDVM